ncbi:MAG: hypothetical protein NTU53_19175 [Planctomycetota bacterium]|nr:hypothetical protein [Planctomycetota bacterium]
MDWPEWWLWELDLPSPHLAKRMLDRGFNDLDLREMLEQAVDLRPNHEPGRWVVETKWNAVPWEVIVEPLNNEQRLLVVTAYALEPPR